MVPVNDIGDYSSLINKKIVVRYSSRWMEGFAFWSCDAKFKIKNENFSIKLLIHSHIHVFYKSQLI